MKQINLILLIDYSSSIQGKKQGILADMILNITQMFQSIISSNGEIGGYIGGICFGKEIDFIPLKPMDNFKLEERQFQGSTPMGEMFHILSEELSKNSVFQSSGDVRNIIVLLSDGVATDLNSNGFMELLGNRSFSNSTRIAVAIGEHVDKETLTAFCNLSKDVYKASDVESIGDVIRQMVHSLTMPKISLKYERREKGDWD